MDRSLGVTRREFVELTGLAAASLFVWARPDGGNQAQADSTNRRRPNRNPDDVLRKLLAGNDRFIKGEPKNPRRKPADFAKLVEGQNPVAVIVGCSDSRVPPELLFDQGIGDLFVVRVAGNVISGAGAIVKGSIEYAVAELGVSLIMVLGHAGCGAVKSALKHIGAADALPGAIDELVRAIKPAVAATKDQPGDPLENAIKANVRIGVNRLKSLKPILVGPVREEKLKVVGAVYDLRTGAVTVVR
jgi:carbonic anhydrase